MWKYSNPEALVCFFLGKLILLSIKMTKLYICYLILQYKLLLIMRLTLN